MRTNAAEVNPSQGSSGPCFSNPSYHTVAQCNVVSTISSNLDGTLTLKVCRLSARVNMSFIHATVHNATQNCALSLSQAP